MNQDYVEEKTVECLGDKDGALESTLWKSKEEIKTEAGKEVIETI